MIRVLSYLLLFLISQYLQVKGQVNNCLFYVQQTKQCLLCDSGYQISSSQLNICEKIQKCQLNQFNQTNNQCSDSCLGQQEVQYDRQQQQINCVDIVYCPVLIPIQDQLIDQKVGIFYYLDKQFQVIFAGNLNGINIIDIESGNNQFTISYQNINESTGQLFYYEYYESSMIISTTNQQRLYLVYTKVRLTPSSQVIDFYQNNQILLNFFVNWDSSQIQIICIFNGELVIFNYNFQSQQKQNPIQINPSNLNIFSFANAIFYSSTSIIIEAIKDSSSQTINAIYLQIQDQNNFSPQAFCQYSKNTFTPVFSPSTQEILFYSVSGLKISNLKSCSDFLSIINFKNIRQVLTNDQKGFLIIISDSSIYGFPFDQNLGIQDINNKLNQQLLLDNSLLEISFCIDYTQTNSQLSIICFNEAKSQLIYLQINENNQFQKFGTFTFTDNILLFTAQKQAILLSTQQQYIFAQGISTFLNDYTQSSCTYQISDQGLNSQTQQLSSKVIIIANTMQSQNFIQQIKLIVNYQQDISNLENINQIKNLKGVQYFQLKSKGSDYISNLQSWIQNMQYPSLVLNLNNITFSQNITIGNSSHLNSVFISKLSISQQINSISIGFINLDLIVFDEVVIYGSQISNSFVFQLKNCSNVIIKNMKILSTTFQDGLSGLFQIISSNQIYLRNLQIVNCNVNSQSLIQITKPKYIQIQNSYFYNNTNQNGQVIYYSSQPSLINIQGSDRLELINLQSIQNNNVTTINMLQSYYNDEGDKVINEKSIAIFQNITVNNNTAYQNSQMSIQSMYFFGDSLNFQNNTSFHSNGTFYLENADIFIQKSNFLNNQAFSGGAIFFNITKFTQIVQCIFKNNNATATGGAVLLLSSQAILNNTLIQSNYAMIGGGIRIEQGKLFYVQYDTKTKIINNKAQLYGQNIVSRLAKRELYVNNQLMTELNQEIVAYLNTQISQYEEYFRIMKAFLTQDLRSGSQIYILVKLYDVDGSLFVYDPNKISQYPSKIQHELRAISGVLTSYVVSIIGEIQLSKFYLSEGGIRSDALTIFGSPGQKSPIFLVENFIEFTYNQSQVKRMRHLQSQILQTNSQFFSDTINCNQNQNLGQAKENQTNLIHSQKLNDFYLKIANNEGKITLLENFSYLNQKNSRKRLLSDVETISAILSSQDVLATGLVIDFKPCQIGEISKVINKDLGIVECLPCPINSYSLFSNQTECQKCPDSAQVCQNSTILLKDGYWRQNKSSDEIYSCDKTIPTCLEFTQKNIGKQCKEGSIGPLCQGCDIHGDHWGKKYSISSLKDGCAECDGQSSQISFLIVLFCLTTFYLLFGIYMAIKNNIHHSTAYYLRMMGIAPISRSSTKDESSQYIKLMTHFLQIVAVINSVSIQMPNVINFVPSFTGNPASSLILSGNCLVSQIGFTDIMRIRVIQSAFLPLVYCLSVIAIYCILCFIRIIKNFQRQFIFTTIIFLIIFFQPDSVMFLLSAVGCKKLGNSLYLIADANYECYTTYEYKVFLYYVTLPSLAIWLLGPLSILYFLRKRKNKLNMISTKKLFGYLYLEYKPNCYYFEFVRSCFKMIIVSIYTLSNSSGSFNLNLIAIIISLYIIISNKIKPFLSLFLFHVDTITHCVLLFGVILSILHINFEQDKDSSYYIAIVVTSLNIFYVSTMVLLIASLKVRQYTFLVSTMQSKIGFILPLLKKIKIASHEQKMKTLLRWKFVKRNIHNIMLYKFNYENIKRIPNQKTICSTEQQLKNQNHLTTGPNNQDNQQLNKKDISIEKNKLLLIETPRVIQSIENCIQEVNIQRNNRCSIHSKNNDKNSFEIFSVACSEININQQSNYADFDNYQLPVFQKFISQKNVLMASQNQINLHAPQK
ncbi:transmembrane protein, putative (macronuclear) [Tetrahymena thermophila SB210]|uniref:Transmembrane protein, putative n=1 Tax=Tetrahymena thermophila (strain SB210) TaxID=312017 RepID=I7MGF3_TETTS|nr:transmembrane protein, putative [Tetrahymena thermophila SB210]EAS01400.2 transmembrane protein, putative [Tetrahymena thermophila SB210]|eukprot:XP_001021646.2 transmembrane protein, putative [Tetrahymena thermophila SB210]